MAVSNRFFAVFSAFGMFLEIQISIRKFLLMKITSATTSHPFCYFPNPNQTGESSTIISTIPSAGCGIKQILHLCMVSGLIKLTYLILQDIKYCMYLLCIVHNKMVYWVTELQWEEGPSDFSRAAYMGFRGADCHVTKLVRSLSARISQTLLVLYLGQCAVRYNIEQNIQRIKKWKTPSGSWWNFCYLV